MSRKILATLAVVLACVVPAAAQVDFRDITLKEAMELARSENKLVFLDGYTTWCGPCKMMDQKIFPQQMVYDFINEKFVSVRFDMESGEGVDIAKRYEVTAFPTYLFIRPDGSLGHRIVGASPTPVEFLEKINEGLDRQVEFGELETAYNGGNTDPETATLYLEALMGAGQFERSLPVMERLFDILAEDEKSDKSLWFIYADDNLSGFGSENFDRLLLDRETFNESVGKDVVDRRIDDVLEKTLTDIIVVRNRSVDASIPAAITGWLDRNDVQDKERLLSYARLASARVMGDRGMMLDQLETLAPQWSDAELSQMFFSLSETIVGDNKQSEQYGERIHALGDRLLGRNDLTRFRAALETYLDWKFGKK